MKELELRRIALKLWNEGFFRNCTSPEDAIIKAFIAGYKFAKTKR
jgi:hypothetical protein